MVLDDKQLCIVQTMCMRKTENESLVYLEDKGFKMARATYQKAKKKIKTLTLKRQFDMIQNGLWEQHMERIDQLELCLKLAWENYENEDKPTGKVRILETIASIQPLLSNYYSMSQKITEHDAKLKELLKQAAK